MYEQTRGVVFQLNPRTDIGKTCSSPALHIICVDEPAGQYIAMVQGSHVELSLPRLVEYVPAVHCVHFVVIDWVAYVPARHC